MLHSSVEQAVEILNSEYYERTGIHFDENEWPVAMCIHTASILHEHAEGT